MARRARRAALGFAVALFGRLLGGAGHAVWIGPASELFGPGLAALGLAPERLLVVRRGRATPASGRSRRRCAVLASSPRSPRSTGST